MRPQQNSQPVMQRKDSEERIPRFCTTDDLVADNRSENKGRMALVVYKYGALFVLTRSGKPKNQPLNAV